MPALSDFLENKLLDHVLGNTAYPQPAGLYIGLFTSDPTDANTATEVAGNAYARQEVTFATAASGSSSNNADVVFPVATGSWGTIAYIGIYDSTTAGNLLFHGQLTTAKAIGVDDQFKIANGNLSISLD